MAAPEAVGGSGGAGGAGPSSSSGAAAGGGGEQPMAAAGKRHEADKGAAGRRRRRAPTPCSSGRSPLRCRHSTTTPRALWRASRPLALPTPLPGGGASRGAAVGSRAHRHLEIGDDEELVGPEGMDFRPLRLRGGGRRRQARGGRGQPGHGGQQRLDGGVNPQTGKRTRRRVTVATTDADGRPYTQAEISRMKRRITNRESARRMRLKRQEEWSAAKAQFSALRDDRARLAARAGAARARRGRAASDAAQVAGAVEVRGGFQPGPVEARR